RGRLARLDLEVRDRGDRLELHGLRRAARDVDALRRGRARRAAHEDLVRARGDVAFPRRRADLEAVAHGAHRPAALLANGPVPASRPGVASTVPLAAAATFVVCSNGEKPAFVTLTLCGPTVTRCGGTGLAPSALPSTSTAACVSDTRTTIAPVWAASSLWR